MQNGPKGANHNEYNEKLVLVGNGMAGIRTIEHILKLAPNAYEITVFGAEPHPNYNRIMLSSVLAGGTSIEDIVINEWSWYEDNGIRVYPVTRSFRSIPNTRKLYLKMVYAQPMMS